MITLDLISKARAALDALAVNPNDPDALRVVGTYHSETGAYQLAIDYLQRLCSAHQGTFETYFLLGQCQALARDVESAEYSFRSAMNCSHSVKNKRAAVIGLSWLKTYRRNREKLVELFIETSLFAGTAWGQSDEVSPTMHNDKYDAYQLIGLMLIEESQGAWSKIVDLAEHATADMPQPFARQVSELLTTAFDNSGGIEASRRYYESTLSSGRTVYDYRPRINRSCLSRNSPENAARLIAYHTQQYFKQLTARGSAIIWAPRVNQDGRVVLRGCLLTPETKSDASFQVSSGDSPNATTSVPAISISHSSRVVVFESEPLDLLPGKPYSCRIVPAESKSSPSIWREFSIPSYFVPKIEEIDGEFISTTGAVFTASFRVSGRGHRYRFVYGYAPTELDRSSPWRKNPPPLTAEVYEPSSRMFNDWIPRAQSAVWMSPERPSLDGSDQNLLLGPGLMLNAPFAKDRNQLCGIGSHEMPLNIGWCHAIDADSQFDPDVARCLSVGGGKMDLRDAKVEFHVKPGNLDCHGSELTFWIGRATTDQLGKFTSQWALTGQLFPEKALKDDSSWHKVDLTLVNHPSQWTYTGNNPIEQGHRANRYRRLPLDENLSANNDPFVLIFAFGKERQPPTGSLAIHGIRAKFRDHSILSIAAGPSLVAAPASAADPLSLTSGKRGLDEYLWESRDLTELPMVFEWEFCEQKAIDRIQINQHPYWPAKGIEIAVLVDKSWRLVWQGEMANIVADPTESNYEYLPHLGIRGASRLRLTITSAYYSDAVGLDGIEAYGDTEEPDMASDGSTCTVSHEVGELSAGRTLYYRFEIHDGEDTFASNTASLARPSTQCPVISSAELRRRLDGSTYIWLRANAMGEETLLYATLTTLCGETRTLEPISLGSQQTGRHAVYELPISSTETNCSVTLIAKNIYGATSLEIANKTIN